MCACVCAVLEVNPNLLHKSHIQNITDISSLSEAWHIYQTLLYRHIPPTQLWPPLQQTFSHVTRVIARLLFPQVGGCVSMSALKTRKHKETKMSHTLPELKWQLPRRTQRSNEWPLWAEGVGETYFRDDVWRAEFTAPATGLTINILFLPVSFLFFIIYNLATVTPAKKKRETVRINALTPTVDTNPAPAFMMSL